MFFFQYRVHFRMKNILLVIACSLCFCSQLVGQSDSVSTNKLFDIPVKDLLEKGTQAKSTTEVVGASQYRQRLKDVPASVVVIEEEQILANNYEDLSDLLKDLPGFDVIENAGVFGEYYVTRGVNGNDRLLVLVDGRKLNAYAGTFLSVGNSVSLRFAQRVEIVYGASSIVYGADAFSCIINIVSKGNSPERQVSSTFSYGSFGAMDASLELKLPITRDFYLTVFGRNYHSDGFDNNMEGVYEAPKDYPLPLSDEFNLPINDHTLFAEARYKDFRFGFFRQHFSEGTTRSLTPAIYVYNDQAKWQVHKNIFWANYEKNFEDKGNLSIDLSHTQHIQDKNSQFFRFIIPNNYNSTQIQFMTGRDHTLKLLTKYNQSIKEVVDFIVGLQLESTNSIPHYANDEVFSRPFQFDGSVRDSIEDVLLVKERKIGVFAQIAIKPTSWINLTIGGRFDYSRLFDNTFNPRVALIIGEEKLITKLMFSTAFQAPSLFYRYEQFGAPTVVMIPNTEQNFTLTNQTIQSAEIEVSYAITDDMSLHVSGFYNKAQNLIERRLYTDSVFNQYFGTFTAGLRNENIGEQSSLGTTVSINGKIGEKLTGYAHYTYTKAEVKNSSGDTPLSRVSEHKFAMGVTCNNLFRYFTVSPRIRWIGPMNTPQASNIWPENQKAPGYLMANLSLRAKGFLPNFVFFGNMENMISSDHSHVGLFQGGIYLDAIPQPKFTGRLGVQFSF